MAPPRSKQGCPESWQCPFPLKGEPAGLQVRGVSAGTTHWRLQLLMKGRINTRVSAKFVESTNCEKPYMNFNFFFLHQNIHILVAFFPQTSQTILIELYTFYRGKSRGSVHSWLDKLTNYPDPDRPLTFLRVPQVRSTEQREGAGQAAEGAAGGGALTWREPLGQLG